jgi:hypothetical protein
MVSLLKLLPHRSLLVLSVCFALGGTVLRPTRGDETSQERSRTAFATLRQQARDGAEQPEVERLGIDAIVNKSIQQVCTDIALPTLDTKGSPLTRPDYSSEARITPVMALDAPRNLEHRDFNWVAPATLHKPLYFEEVNLERHGYSSFVLMQPVVSAAHFFGTVPLLPYKLAAQPPHKPIYTLGHYRPGSCVPYRIHSPPWCLEAATVEAGVITGLIFLIP